MKMRKPSDNILELWRNGKRCLRIPIAAWRPKGKVNGWITTQKIRPAVLDKGSYEMCLIDKIAGKTIFEQITFRLNRSAKCGDQLSILLKLRL